MYSDFNRSAAATDSWEGIISLKEKKSSIKAVLFDLDGTLIDSVPAYFKLMESILDAVGLPPASRPMIADFMARGLPAFENMIPAEMHDQKDQLIEECLTIGRKLLKKKLQDDVDLIPGVEKLFHILAQRKIPIGIVSSTMRAYIDIKLEPLAAKGIKKLLSSVVATEDAPRKKPAPDPLIVCARELAVPLQRCVYIGDSNVDIQAGNEAGMLTVGVLTGLHDRETLDREGPTIILDSVADLIPWFTRDLI